MAVASEISFLIFILMSLSFLGLIQLLGGPKIIEPFDFIWLSGGILGVAGACTIATGIPCAGALAIFGIASFTKYLFFGDAFTMAIFIPIFVILIYIVSRLARGGG